MNVENVWIGERALGGVYAYDHEIQVCNNKFVYLFDFHVSWPQKFRRKNLKGYFKTVSNKEIKEKYKQEYVNWKKSYGNEFIKGKTGKSLAQITYKNRSLKMILYEHGVNKLYHFTDLENIKSIKKCGGLYSWRYLNQKNIVIPRPGGTEASRIVDKRKGLQDYVHLSFNDNPPMLYKALEEGRIKDPVIIEIRLEILEQGNTLISDINAVDKNANIGKPHEMIDRVQLDIVTSNWTNEKEKSFYQAEALIKRKVPKNYFLRFRRKGHGK